MTELGEFGMGLAALGGFIAIFFGPIGTAIGRRISGKGIPPAGITTAEVAAERMVELEERMAGMEQERRELEERLEFAERMLARGKDAVSPSPNEAEGHG